MNRRTASAVEVKVDPQPLLTPVESTVHAYPTGERLDLVTNPQCDRVYTTTLAFLYPPLKLRQSLPVAIKCWTDGVVEAHLSDALLYGTGEDEVEAIDDLREQISDAWRRLSGTPESSMAKPAWRMWLALKALCREGASE